MSAAHRGQEGESASSVPRIVLKWGDRVVWGGLGFGVVWVQGGLGGGCVCRVEGVVRDRPEGYCPSKYLC